MSSLRTTGSVNRCAMWPAVRREPRVEPHIVELALGHADPHSRLASVYNRARHFRQVAEALQRLADHLDGIVAGGAEVVALAR